jgi:O-6-methylguanine DNA methyltransferase
MDSGLVLSTALGPVGLVWSERGLRRVFLPLLGDEGEAMERLVRKHGKLVSTREAFADLVSSHLDGEAVDYAGVPLDLEVTPFAMSVYRAAQKIPRGTTVTYADLGREIGNPSARAIGTALGKNPAPIVVPCHRIVSAGGIGGFSAPGGNSTKAQLLAVEGGALGDPEHVIARWHLSKVDPLLAPIVKKIACNLPVKPRGNLFRTIVRAIAGQQLSTKAAATIFGRLEQALGIVGDTRWSTGALANPWPVEAAQKLLALDDATLRGVGLSGSKMASIRDLATRVTTGALALERVERLPDERVIEVLTEVRGIGRWTAEMLLIFDLGRPDVLPVDDLGIKKGLQKVHGLRALPDAAVIEKRAEAWRPFRSIGSWYLWRALDATPA